MYKKVSHKKYSLSWFAIFSLRSSSLLIGALLIPNLAMASNVEKEKQVNSASGHEWKKHTQIHRHPRTGKTRFIGFSNKNKITTKNGETKAKSIANTYGAAFGISNPAEELKLTKKSYHRNSVTTFRYQQLYKGLPVIAAELVAAVDAQDQMNFISGETAENLSLSTDAKITSVQAKEISLGAITKWYQGHKSNLTVSSPELAIFKANMISPNTMPATLIWKLEIKADMVNELIFVDAHSGAIIFHLNQIHSALNRQTYTANNSENLQVSLLCDESNLSCSGDSDALAAHRYAEDTYNFYSNKHARDGIDGSGGVIISNVHGGGRYSENAVWTGTQIVYGNGFPQADDVVAHELTHGITENESNLFYYYQAGAINESFSDLWGEFVDQTNTGGSDSISDKWLIGEDLPIFGVIRNMKTPGAFSDPDRISSADYYTGSQDYGGVHTNSGVNNKAAYLMVEGTVGEAGGTFNGQTITGIGIDKVAKLYYEVQTMHLTSGSDYLDLYNALIQACSDLVTNATLIASDCTQVQAALTAVEMNQTRDNSFNPDATFCPTGTTKNTPSFSDTFESGLTNWSFSHDTRFANSNWVDWLTVAPTAPFAISGTHSLYAANVISISDQYAQISVSIPAISSLEKAFLYFNHAIDLELTELTTKNIYYDGAVLEYSTNGGTGWVDAADLIVDGKNYTGVINHNNSNPIKTRIGFAGRSNGYVSTRVNLSSFSGSTILLRWRVATDLSVEGFGWLLDDVSIYTCVGTVNSLPIANAGSDVNVNNGTFVSLNGNSSSDVDDGFITNYEWKQVGGNSVTINNATTATPSFSANTDGSILAFQLTVTDSDGQTDSDIVNVIVNTSATVFAGDDISAVEGSRVTLANSSSIDSDGSIVSYQWVQTAGDSVTLITPNSTTVSFDAPDPNQVITLALRVTDNDGTVSSDSVNITITARRSFSSGGGGGGGCSLNSSAEFNPFMFFMLLGLSIVYLSNKLRRQKRS